METLLRQYTLSEFELEFGSIQMESLNDGVAITENGVEIALAKHLKAAIEINIGRFYYLIFQTGASRQNLIKPRLSAFVSCKINDLV